MAIIYKYRIDVSKSLERKLNSELIELERILPEKGYADVKSFIDFFAMISPSWKTEIEKELENWDFIILANNIDWLLAQFSEE